eukprot:CAMPEP_0174732540 /NCGR_PEP_ID=MMETSP1094-20130205/59593_1 /TAXON_ID=156173 /ORGANISM="Chrysochromulina brevifilum, Strain UTEX LB 985" /LENGTH=68 /DNA_ID=CAMNT_0015935067 /DNA_START=312 /DNA_END=516 /DNA_ORIENTATION=+
MNAYFALPYVLLILPAAGGSATGQDGRPACACQPQVAGTTCRADNSFLNRRPHLPQLYASCQLVLVRA